MATPEILSMSPTQIEEKKKKQKYLSQSKYQTYHYSTVEQQHTYAIMKPPNRGAALTTVGSKVTVKSC